MVQTGTICAWPICAPIESLVSCLTNSLGLLIPLLRHSPPWPGHSASVASGEVPQGAALARGLRDQAPQALSPKSWTQRNWQPPAPIPCARIQFNSSEYPRRRHAGPRLERALPSSLWLAQAGAHSRPGPHAVGGTGRLAPR